MSRTIELPVWQRKRREMMDGKEVESRTSSIETTQTKSKTIKGKSKGMVGKKNKAKQHPLLSYNELPEYMKDNEFILNYYRAEWPLKEALFSLFRWHNETLNVWTHLIGFGLFLGLMMSNLVNVPQLSDLFGVFPSSSSSPPFSSEANISHNLKDLYQVTIKLINLNSPEMEMVSPVQKWPFFVFLAGSLFCLFSSTTCHLFSCHSHNLNVFLLRIDYVGIAVMIITSFFPPIYYIFQCQPLWQIFYLAGISAMGTFTIGALITPKYAGIEYRTFRASLFVGMGLSGLIPAVHGTLANWNEPRRNAILGYEAAMAVSYLTGATFYIFRIPERFRPGWFDLAGHSHQLFHVFVVFGALAHYAAALMFIEYRGSVGC